MSISISLYSCTSDKTSVEKTVALLTTVSGVLKSDCNVINPVVRVHTSTDDLFSANYAYIDTFERRYFINDIKIIQQGIYEIYMHCDVLTTYWNQIKDLSAIVKRQEKAYNLYIKDDACPVAPQKLTGEILFNHGFSNGASSYVLAING